MSVNLAPIHRFAGALRVSPTRVICGDVP